MPNSYSDTPIASHTLAADQPVMEANFNYLANTLGTSNAKNGDHQISIGGADNNAFEGRHRQVCFNNRNGSEPVATSIADGVDSLLYSKNGNVYFSSSLGASPFQLTTYNAQANFGASPNGWTFLPGGLILQYGTSAVNTVGTPTTITFPMTFPTAVLSITMGFVNNAGGNSPAANSAFVKSGSVATNQFVVMNSSSGNLTNIYWMAIGN